MDYVVKLAHPTEPVDVKIVDNTKLVVTGIECGVTTATIEVSGNESQVIAITVRKNSGNGWM